MNGECTRLREEVARITRERDEARAEVAAGAVLLARQTDLARAAEIEVETLARLVANHSADAARREDKP
jgi:hypothetical protein